MPILKIARNKILYSAPVVVADSLNEPVKDSTILTALSDMSCLEGTVLDYLDPDFPERDQLRGGYLRLVVDGKKLMLHIEIDSPDELNETEAKQLKDDLDGQVSDGIGSGAFDFIHSETGLTVEAEWFKDSSLTQKPGEAWQPKDKAVESSANKSRCTAASSAAEKAEQEKEAKQAKSKSAKKNPKKLFKLVEKANEWPTPEGIAAEVAEEIKKLGGDLGFIPDCVFPYRNWRHHEVLRLLLEARLRPNLIDEGGHPLLYLCACDEECCKLCLSYGPDINLPHEFDGTALMRAAGFGEDRIVKLLLDHGADPHFTTKFGKKTALDKARGNKHKGNIPETIALLEQAMQR